jgi:hypothetical protein
MLVVSSLVSKICGNSIYASQNLIALVLRPRRVSTLILAVKLGTKLFFSHVVDALMEVSTNHLQNISSIN